MEYDSDNTAPNVPGWADDSLSKFINISEYNTRATFSNYKTLYGSLLLADEIFLKLSRNLNNSENWPLFPFLVRSHSSFLGAVRMGMSCQLVEVYPLQRVALEQALYGFYLHRKPELRETWLRRHNDEASKKLVRDTFKIGTLKQELHRFSNAIHNRFEKYYEDAIDWGAHPNERAMSGNADWEQIEGGCRFTMTYLSKKPVFIRAALNSTACVGVCCLEILSEIFRFRFEILRLDEKLEKLRTKILQDSLSCTSLSDDIQF